jgi:hypothetical protein
MTNQQAEQVLTDCALRDYDEEPTPTWRANIRSVLSTWMRSSDERAEVTEAVETLGGIDTAIDVYAVAYEEIHRQEYDLE